MLLSEIFDQLTYGELKDLSIGGQEKGSIGAENYAQVVSYVNLALTELYTRFPLKKRNIDIQLYEDIDVYYLDSAYSVVDGSASTLYLVDTVSERFIDNVLKIVKIYDEDSEELVFNDLNEATSIRTYDYNALLVPNPDPTEIITVEYWADHDPISHINLDPTTVEVRVPRSLLKALLNFIAHRAYASTPPLDGVDRAGQYYGKFERCLQTLSNTDAVVHVEQSNEKLRDRGWP